MNVVARDSQGKSTHTALAVINGFPLTIVTSRADVHDSVGAIGLTIDVIIEVV